MDPDSRPIRLVYYDEEEGMLRIDESAASILQAVEGPIGVVSVCGPARQGKSYISNQLLGRSDGFKVERRREPDRCTKGLWMWIAPSRETAADGTEYSMIVMDSEGIDRCKQKVPYFYLAVVLSSMLLYNERGYIGDTCFPHLSVVTDIADMTAGRVDLSPIFVCVLRDFYMDWKDSSPNQYLEHYLKLLDTPKGYSDSTIEAINEQNKVTNSIKTVFPERHCFTLIAPMHIYRHLGFDDSMPEDAVGEYFKKGMDELRSFVFEKTKPKKIGANVMTGPIFVQITRYILDAFNTGKRPMLPSIWKNVAKTERQKALTSTLVGSPPAANTRQKKKSMQQVTASQKKAQK